MPYMHCARCGLSVRVRTPYLVVDHCPRCLARRRLAVPMSRSDNPAAFQPAGVPDTSELPHIRSGVRGDGACTAV